MNAPDDTTMDTLFAPPHRVGWTYRTPSPPLRHPARTQQVASLSLPPSPAAIQRANKVYRTGLGLAARTAVAALIVLGNSAANSDTSWVVFLYLCGLGYALYVLVDGLKPDRRYSVATGIAAGFLTSTAGFGRQAEQRYRHYRRPAIIALAAFIVVLVIAFGLSALVSLPLLAAAVVVCVGFPAVMILSGKQLKGICQNSEHRLLLASDSLQTGDQGRLNLEGGPTFLTIPIPICRAVF